MCPGYQRLLDTGWWLYIPANKPKPAVLTPEMIEAAIASMPSKTRPHPDLLPPRMFRAYTELLP